MPYTTRISFNSNNWERPSGITGKSPNHGSAFEARYGFGFEEWLFCKRNQFKNENGELIQYGYLQGIAESHDSLEKKMDIDLWTLEFLNNGNRNTRSYIATIKDWALVSFEENKNIIKSRPTVINEMQLELLNVLPQPLHQNCISEFDKARQGGSDEYGIQLQLFNIKFKPISINIPTFIPFTNPVYRFRNNSFHMFTLENIRS